MSEEHGLLLDSDIIFSFDPEQLLEHICTCLRSVEASSVKIKEDELMKYLLS